MRIFLVRHGESLGNVNKDIHKSVADHAIGLSPKGEQQALAAGAFLNSYLINEASVASNIDLRFSPGRRQQVLNRLPRMRLWTSPYARTRQTAEAIHSSMMSIIPATGLDIKEHVNLCEQQFGLFDGIPDEDLPNQYPDEYDHYRKCMEHGGRFWARMPLGESRFDVAVRVHQAFGTFHRDADRHGVKDIIVVCHGVTLRAFVMQWLHLTPEWFDAESNPGNCWIRLIEKGVDKGYIYTGEF